MNDTDDPEFQKRAQEALDAYARLQARKSGSPNPIEPMASDVGCVAKAKALDKRLWNAALYRVSEGHLKPVSEDDVRKVFREMKHRLNRLRSFSSVEQIEISVFQAYGPKGS